MSRRRRNVGMVRSLLSTLLSPVASTIGFAASWIGGYSALDPRRKPSGAASRLAASRATANQLLNNGGPQLRAYCRALERNNPTARAGIEALTALIVGTGIALEPDTGNPDWDARMREEFNRMIDHIGVHGESIYQLQALGVREMVTAGEGIWRIVPNDDPAGPPVLILPLDAEWLSEDEASSDGDLTIAAGIGLDRYGRPRRYYLRNPETQGAAEPVPADSVVHFFERRRPVQHRGEPWFAPIIESMMQERDLVDAELEAAVNTAAIGVVIESDRPDDEGVDDEIAGRDPINDIGLRSVARLYPGEKLHAFSHQRPSQQIAPFRQMLRGDIAAALRVPQRFLDRDVSRANYSSMRADMLDTERLLCPVKEWYGHQTIGALYRTIYRAVASRAGVPLSAVTPHGYRLVPDSQPYVDPTKDIQAALMAIEGGLSTYEHEIGKRGEDYRQVMEQQAVEKALLESHGLHPRFKGDEVITEHDEQGGNDA